jgi:hypothetical protein
MSAHHDAIDLAPAQKGEDCVGGRTGTDYNTAADVEIPGAFGERFKTFTRGAGDGDVVAADGRRLRCGAFQAVMHMKDDEVCARLDGLGNRKAEGLFIGGKLGSEEDGGRLAPT